MLYKSLNTTTPWKNDQFCLPSSQATSAHSFHHLPPKKANHGKPFKQISTASSCQVSPTGKVPNSWLSFLVTHLSKP